MPPPTKLLLFLVTGSTLSGCRRWASHLRMLSADSIETPLIPGLKFVEYCMTVLLTDFWTYVTNQQSPALWVEEACFHICRWLPSPWHRVLSPGHSSKPTSHTSCLHPYHQPQCLYFTCCSGQTVLPHRFPPCHSILPGPGAHLDHLQPGLWLFEFLKYTVCLENITYFFFWVFQYRKHQSTSFHIVYNVFKYTQNIIMSLFYCHKCFPTSTLKGVKKIWNQRSLCV